MGRSDITQAGSDPAIVALVSHAAVTGTAGVVSGMIVGGVGGRLVMRISAIVAPGHLTGIRTENGNRIGDITFEGTIALVIFVGLFSGIFGAAAYLMTEPWLEWTGGLHGPAFGLVLLFIASPAVIVPDNIDFVILRNRELNVGMFATLFIAFGVSTVWLRSAFEAWLLRAGAPVPAFVAATVSPVALWRYIALGAFGAVIVIPLVAQSFVEETCGCEPGEAAGGFVIAMGVATLALWFLHATGWLRTRWAPLLHLAGYLTLVGSVVTGGFRFVSDVREIV